jgi:hypothetical protein
MYAKKDPIVLTFKREATSSADFTLKTKPWENCDYIVILAVSARNEDANNTWVHVAAARGGVTIYIESLDLKEDTAFYVTHKPMYLPEGYRIICRFQAHNEGDKYTVNIFGYTVTYCEE